MKNLLALNEHKNLFFRVDPSPGSRIHFCPIVIVHISLRLMQHVKRKRRAQQSQAEARRHSSASGDWFLNWI